MPSRRNFLRTAGAEAAATLTVISAMPTRREAAQEKIGSSRPARAWPPTIPGLKSMKGQAKPISADELRARIEKARRLSVDNRLDALMLMGGTSLTYFSNIRWGGGERLFALV